jgi:hypothetical protein
MQPKQTAAQAQAEVIRRRIGQRGPSRGKPATARNTDGQVHRIIGLDALRKSQPEVARKAAAPGTTPSTGTRSQSATAAPEAAQVQVEALRRLMFTPPASATPLAY